MRRLTSLAGLIALFLCSCDPGFRVVPVGWKKLESGHFERQVGDLHIETAAVGGLAGEWWVGVDYLVTDAKKPVVPKTIVLVTSQGRFPGKFRETPHSLPADAASQPGKALLGADWQFPKDTTLPKNLGESPTVEVSFLYGDERRHFTVSYRRE
jgi:hypothetical protein